MADALPVVYLARHGETAWSLSGQYTGLTDLPLTERGERTAQRLGERLSELTFLRVFTSPLQCALKTCTLAGYRDVAQIDPDLVEWDYGQFEGRRTAEIVAERPGWQLFRDGCPGGESPQQVAARADQVVARARRAGQRVAIFERAFYPGLGSSLAGTRAHLEQPLFRTQHGQPECARLRTRAIPSRDSALE